MFRIPFIDWIFTNVPWLLLPLIMISALVVTFVIVRLFMLRRRRVWEEYERKRRVKVFMRFQERIVEGVRIMRSETTPEYLLDRSRDCLANPNEKDALSVLYELKKRSDTAESTRALTFRLQEILNQIKAGDFTFEEMSSIGGGPLAAYGVSNLEDFERVVAWLQKRYYK